ncbi:MAG: hypothetical protein JOZ80_00665, partial [Acidobacteriaceae bacterium]|nr:hypothetical protein [Acidobacteriaceae bacterium]
MAHMTPGLSIALTLTLASTLAAAQEVPPLLVLPSKAIMLLSETRTFRAVGKDGRIRNNVAWSISGSNDAEITTNGDEATVRALNPTRNLVLTANFAGDSAQASIEISSEKVLK